MDIAKDKLIELRKERGWSQSRLATISGLGERTIQRIEKEGTCSLESVMALASVFELSPKDLEKPKPETIGDPPASPVKTNWSGLLGMGVLIACAYIIIDLTAKYPSWERISAGLVFGLTITFSVISYGAKRTYACMASTYWIVRAPQQNMDFNIKIKQTKSLLEYSYIIGVVSCLVCGLTIAVHSEINPNHTLDYLTYMVRPLVYAILFAELWIRPLKHRLEYLLQLELSHSREEG